MATSGRKRYFYVDENASSEQMHDLLDDIESADEDEIDNFMILTLGSLIKRKLHRTLPGLHERLIFTQCQVIVSQKRKKEKKKNYGFGPNKSYVKVTKQEEDHHVTEI